MSQQHTRFEEAFHQTSPSTPFQSDASDSASRQAYSMLAGQKLVIPQEEGQAPGPGQRLALAIISLVFVFLTFMITLLVVAIVRNDLFPIAPLAISFALIFAVVTLLLNILFNRKH